MNKTTYHVVDGDNVLIRTTSEEQQALRFKEAHEGSSIIMTVEHEIIFVDHVPTCAFCDKPGLYDSPTTMGPWGNMCKEHWRQYSPTGRLGTGLGQIWLQRPKQKS
jgi:hypothetical protein